MLTQRGSLLEILSFPRSSPCTHSLSQISQSFLKMPLHPIFAGAAASHLNFPIFLSEAPVQPCEDSTPRRKPAVLDLISSPVSAHGAEP